MINYTEYINNRLIREHKKALRKGNIAVAPKHAEVFLECLMSAE